MADQRSVACADDTDAAILPSGHARRLLVWAQAALTAIPTAAPEPEPEPEPELQPEPEPEPPQPPQPHTQHLQRLHRELVVACLASAYDIEKAHAAKIALRDALEAAGAGAVVLPPPDCLARTEFGKLRGFELNQPQEVLPGLWIANARPAHDIALLQRLGIGMVVRCYDLQAGTSAGRSVEQCRRLPQAYAEAGIECLELPLNDRCVHGHRCDHSCEHGCVHDQKLAPAIAAASAFVPPSSRRTTDVLVHCGAGVSRSASVSRHDIAGTWVAFFSRCQRYSLRTG